MDDRISTIVVTEIVDVVSSVTTLYGLSTDLVVLKDTLKLKCCLLQRAVRAALLWLYIVTRDGGEGSEEVYVLI